MSDTNTDTDNDLIAEDTEAAKGEYAAFFERNKDGIEFVSVSPNTYYIRRGWTVKGPIPKGAIIEHVGLANPRRIGHKKTGYRHRGKG